MNRPAYFQDARPFDAAWTLADSTALFEQIQAASDRSRDQADRDVLQKAVFATLERVGQASFEQLLLQIQAGQVGPVPHTAGRRMVLPNLWNTLITTDGFEEAWQANQFQDDLIRMFKGAALYRFAFPHPTLDTPERFDQALRHAARDGHWGKCESEQFCFVTGERYRLAFEGWQPILMEIGANYRLHPVTTDGPGTPLEHVTVDLPTGELLISDWFRLPAFTRLDESRPGYHAEEIGASEGRRLRTRINAGMGFVHVYGGGSRQVYQVGNQVRLGYTDVEEVRMPEGKHQGTVSGALHWTTMIDRAVLEALLIQGDPTLTAEQATQAVQAYVADRSNEVRTVRLTPGTYHLHFADHSQSFDAQFESPEANLTDLEAICVLSDHELPLVPKGTLQAAPVQPSKAPPRRRRAPR